MPVWLLPILLNIGQFVWHAVCRFWSVFLVGAVILIIAMQFHAFKLTQYNIGYKVGYSQAMTDHPAITVNSGGTVNTNVVKTVGLEIDGFGLGIWHRR